MFRFAHSLGYPHPNALLASLTAAEYRELLAFFGLEAEARERAEAMARESNLRQWFDRKHARQERLRKSG